MNDRSSSVSGGGGVPLDLAADDRINAIIRGQRILKLVEGDQARVVSALGELEQLRHLALPINHVRRINRAAVSERIHLGSQS
ncbi:MAG: hypothetical protein ACRDIE_02670 [Chloroflexota bacterium]